MEEIESELYREGGVSAVCFVFEMRSTWGAGYKAN
ncbi:hypothetical protein COLO4_05381 [Corchorus olitorius]|uniref:Uncharacterized protein n=1 Tax=Corchorus olitorius TaxID=93759 RepID=A0A1R3KR59_9ROSI|nr:hypothetical protein COLO4_05381 [Corchorus olitorius]